MSEEWKWFNVETLSEDAIIFAFQLLYKHHTVFLRQHWLGVVAMQVTGSCKAPRLPSSVGRQIVGWCCAA